jgi:DNA repair protein RadD
MPLVAMPTGSGKAFCIAYFASTALKTYNNVRILMLVHTKELVKQNVATLLRMWPQAPVGIFSAGLHKKQTTQPIIFGSVQSVAKSLSLLGKFNIILVDECHRISPADETTYALTIAHFKSLVPSLVVIGYTATAFRAKQGMLTENGLFTKIVYDLTSKESFNMLVEMGFLCPLFSKSTAFKYDTSKVKITAGDFNQSDLQAAVDTDDQTTAALQEALQIGAEKDHWMVFCAGTDHVDNVSHKLQSWGEAAVGVHSKMSDAQRDEAIAGFLAGKYRMIVSDAILNTGFDAPFVDHLVLLAPTRALNKHIQTLGRGVRPVYVEGFDLETKEGRLDAIAASEKPFCRVSDFAGNLARLGPINDPNLPKKKGTGAPPLKICPECGTYNWAAARICEEPSCGYEFPPPEEKETIESRASVVPAMAKSHIEVNWFKVDRVEYELYTRPLSDPSMKVKYYCEGVGITELVSIEHHSPTVRHKAQLWWKARLSENLAVPSGAVDGMRFVDQLKIPTHIFAQVGRKNYIYLNCTFTGETPMFRPERPASVLDNA